MRFHVIVAMIVATLATLSSPAVAGTIKVKPDNFSRAAAREYPTTDHDGVPHVAPRAG